MSEATRKVFERWLDEHPEIFTPEAVARRKARAEKLKEEFERNVNLPAIIARIKSSLHLRFPLLQVAPDLSGKQPRMNRNEANQKAMGLAKRMKADFFRLSERKQAKLIGCSVATWRKTAFYQTAKRKRARQTASPKSPKAINLSAKLEATTDRQDALDRLIAEQAQDCEPSPLEEDAPGKPKKVKCRKRL